MNVTIGQFYPVNSVIHKLDARVKLLSTMTFIAAVFIAKDLWGYAIASFFVALVIKMSKVPPRLIFRGLKGIIFIICFTMILNIFFNKRGEVIFEFSFLQITSEGLYIAVKMAVRLILLVVGSSVLTLTTSPIQLTDGIEYTLKPFKKIGLPAHEIAMMMTIALRFIPTLMDELDKIRKAQMARGANFDTGGLTQKAKSLIPLLVPLFISSFRRADELAMAMEARCYRGDINRTRMKQLMLTKIDYIAIVIMAVFVVLMIAIRVIF